MKYLILFLISFSVMANFIPQSKIGEGLTGLKIFRKIKRCESFYKESCISIPVGYNHKYHVKKEIMVDDATKPTYSAKTDIVACTDQENCQNKLSSLTCTDIYAIKFIAEDYTEIYCTKIIGYEQKPTGKYHIIEDAVKKAAHTAEVVAEKTAQAELDMVKKSMDVGKDISAKMALRNLKKGLTKKQVRQFVKDYKDIKNLLDTGAIDSAKEAIEELIPDGVITTQDDKDAIIAEINKALGL